MSDDFSKDQRETIKKIAKDVIERSVSRPEDAAGEIRVPDVARTRQIASEQIEAWRKAQPPWWDLRRRLDSKLAGAGLLGVLILAGVDVLLEKHDIILGGLHWIAGTEARIDAQLDAWAAEDTFSKRSRDVLKGMATAEAPELTDLVKRALDSQPILTFQGQARLGSIAPVQVESAGCERLVSYWFDSQPENLAKKLRANMDGDKLTGADFARLSAACATEGRITGDDSLGIPFWARFHPDENGVKDEVYVLIHVVRTLHEKPERTEIALPTRERDPPRGGRCEPGVDPPQHHPYALDARGLRIEYLPSDEGRLLGGVEALDLTAIFSDRTRGFFFGQIDEQVAAATKPPPEGKHLYFELVHSLTISLPDPPADAGDDYCCQEWVQPKPDAVCLDEMVQVVAMVMVNRVP